MNQKNYAISKDPLTKELKKEIYKGFREHAIESVNSDGNLETITFIARQEDQFLGAIHSKHFWGALHIKYLYVAPFGRGKGIGRALMHQALEDGRKRGCRFACVETMSFQAVDFYKSLGFKEDFVRSGYDMETSFHYLSTNLTKTTIPAPEDS